MSSVWAALYMAVWGSLAVSATCNGQVVNSCEECILQLAKLEQLAINEHVQGAVLMMSSVVRVCWIQSMLGTSGSITKRAQSSTEPVSILSQMSKANSNCVC